MRFAAYAAALAAGALFAGVSTSMPAASADPFDPGTLPLSRYAPTGDHEPVSTAAVVPCQGVYAVAEVVFRLMGKPSDLTCTQNGLFGVDLYYPKDIATMSRVPAIVWGPGSTADPGNYDASARLWAGNGFVVAIPHDLLNSLPEIPIAGAAALSQADHDPGSALFGKVDLSRTVIGGHSGGGAAAIEGASIPPTVYRQIDPDLRIIGAVPTEPSPYSTSFLLDVPTLYLAGSMDFVVPHLMTLWLEYPLATNAPAFIVTVKNATHLTPLDDVAHNPMAGITLAWLQYLVNDDKTAASYFVGPDWKLPADPAVDYALRNDRAEHLPA
ncbi:hypothetical protein [Nocardia sp. NPDC051570]|uniref:poly(ethylene terephthalate) hydrolase family protein n=1 Tax=Nocardia sp. NPDC051570 TaxID=3364324 RepID=UPI0037B28536